MIFLNQPKLFYAHRQMISSIAKWQSQSNIIHLFTRSICSIWAIDKTLTGVTTPSQSWSGTNGNEGVFHIPQIS